MAAERYNPSLLMPIIDVVVAVSLFTGAALVWFNTKGQEQILAAEEALVSVREEQASELAAKEREIRRGGNRLVDLKNEQRSKKQYEEALALRIADEEARIAQGEEKDRRYTDELLDLRDGIRLAKEELRGNESDAAEEGDRVMRRGAEMDSLRAEIAVREKRISELENEIAEAIAVRKHDPWSIFPARAGFLAAYEVGQDDNRIVAGLSHDVFDLQSLRFGVHANLGFSDSEDTSLKEGGVYMNIPVIFRRASIEVGAGLAGVRVGALSTQYDPFLSGHFRLAPIRRERLFLLGGPYFTPDNVAFRLGLGIGRR